MYRHTHIYTLAQQSLMCQGMNNSYTGHTHTQVLRSADVLQVCRRSTELNIRKWHQQKDLKHMLLLLRA